MCPTPIGRIHTRVASIVLGPAVLGLILTLVTGHLDWIVLVGVYLLLGVFLDTAVYPWLLELPAALDDVRARRWSSTACCWRSRSCSRASRTSRCSRRRSSTGCCWVLAVWVKVVMLPILSLTYLESAGEFRRAQWSQPAEQVALPVLASVEEARRGPGKLLAEASGVHATPLQALPAPSGVHAVPRSRG